MTNPHIETLVNFLRDFASANADSFDPEQIEYLKQSSHAIVILDKAVDELVKERDDAFKQIDALISERDELLKEVKDLTERHAHMSNIALGSRADVHQTRRDLDKANKERDEAIADRDWFYKLLVSTAEQNDKESEEWDTEEEDSDAETNP